METLETARPLRLLELIQHLEDLPRTEEVPLGQWSFSYRGYYDRLCLERGESQAAPLARTLRARIGETMTGYKGGEYLITNDTWVHVADYGVTGPQIGLTSSEKLILVQEVW